VALAHGEDDWRDSWLVHRWSRRQARGGTGSRRRRLARQLVGASLVMATLVAVSEEGNVGRGDKLAVGLTQSERTGATIMAVQRRGGDNM